MTSRRDDAERISATARRTTTYVLDNIDIRDDCIELQWKENKIYLIVQSSSG